MNDFHYKITAVGIFLTILTSVFFPAFSRADSTINLAETRALNDLPKNLILPEDICCLRISIGEETLPSDLILAPPPGDYYFRSSDQVILSLFDDSGALVPMYWNGAQEAASCHKVLTLQEHTEILLSSDPMLSSSNLQRHVADQTIWFDVPEELSIYVFLGGGNLYGWFTGKRHIDFGAGITGLVHSASPWMPVFERTNLNFEHIFSNRPEDTDRSLFTPRIDPFSFSITGPDKLRVRWDKARSSWGLDCEMVYEFSGGDVIDISFSFVPEEDHASLDYLGFMWASYMQNARERGIYFPTDKNNQEQWFLFSPDNNAHEKNGNAVLFSGAHDLKFNHDEPSLLLKSNDALSAATPFYTGDFYPDINTLVFDKTMHYVMMFNVTQGLRYAVYNWGPMEYYSAWDWQYLITAPPVGKICTYQMRCLISESADRERIADAYDEWTATLGDNKTEQKTIATFPELPFYWSPTTSFLNLSFMGKLVEPYEPEQSLKWYRYLLEGSDSKQAVAFDIDAFYLRQDDIPGLIQEWEGWAEQNEEDPTAWLHLGIVYMHLQDFEKAAFYFSESLSRDHTNAHALLHAGINQLYLQQIDSGFNQICDAINHDPVIHSSVPNLLDQCAEWYGEKQDTETVISFYTKALEFFPDDLWYAVRLAEYLEVKGEFNRAEERYRNILHHAPESPYSADKLDALLRKETDETRRTRVWKEIHQRHEEAYTPALYLSKALYDLERYDQSLGILEGIMERAEEKGEGLMYQGLCHLSLNHREKGTTYLEKALQSDALLAATMSDALSRKGDLFFAQELFEKAIVFYTLAEKYDSKNLWHRVRQGECLEQLGDKKAAIARYTEILCKAPESPYTAHKLDALLQSSEKLSFRLDSWSAIYHQNSNSLVPAVFYAKSLYLNQLFEKAVSVLNHVLDMEADHAPARLYKGLCLLSLEDVEQGEALLHQVLVIDPLLSSEAVTCLTNLGDTLFSQGNNNEALTMYRRAESLESGNLWHRVRQGECLEKLGQIDDAIELFTSILVTAGDSPYTAAKLEGLLVAKENNQSRIDLWQTIYEQSGKMSVSGFYFGRALLENHQCKEAQAVFTEIMPIAEDPNRIDLYLGLCELCNGNEQQGNEKLQTALNQNPTLTTEAGALLASLGKRAFAEGRLNDAVNWYGKAVACDPGNLRHAQGQAESLVKSGAIAEARTIYTMILEEAPESPSSAEALDTLFLKEQNFSERENVWQALHTKHKEAVIPLLFYCLTLFDLEKEEKAIVLLKDFFSYTDPSEEVVSEMKLTDSSENNVSRVIHLLQKCADRALEAGDRDLSIFLMNKGRSSLLLDTEEALDWDEWIEALKH